MLLKNKYKNIYNKNKIELLFYFYFKFINYTINIKCRNKFNHIGRLVLKIMGAI